MRRWGWRLFECNQDLDAVLTLTRDLGDYIDSWKHSLSAMVHQTDMLAPLESIAMYNTEEYADRLANDIIPYIRQKLDTDNLGEKLFAASRAKENESDDMFREPKYQTIILGALMMRCGARINAADLQHLRDLVPQVVCSPHWTPFGDLSFRTPGKAQFLAALDHYEPGVPRNFQEPSCFTCGRIKAEIGHKPLKCKRCKVATYCDTDCQNEQWTEHRSSCVPPHQRRVLHV
ncbi:Zinc finger MYND-type [Penicillium cf. griseofulvum]|uniref:Zinc finger MYND-type n=1 Tax=Penicillium cf. griseofulvum TaxID=2972120 RepID=A0A9W9M1K4_9EURO|nr:Zinc finger MYND-type [Penicillium cf. griseofulvum]KAJ5429346.1 Zinc finger MYND-type [Penicillium cf. griseofulvum]KAJ5436875.1 Zinc finger MYND-type [Penicillium cf. griseofulvum]